MKRAVAWTATAAVAMSAINASPTIALISRVGVACAPTLAGIGRRGHAALTFDDGPDLASTPLFLDALAALGCSATFFLLGSMIEHAPVVVRRIVDEGHEVAVHQQVHRSSLLRTPAQLTKDLDEITDRIAELAGATPKWYRPPYGHLSIIAARSARARDLQPVLWSAWGRDWRARATPVSIVADVHRGRVDGGTILLHDSDCTSVDGSWRATLEALPILVRDLRRMGLEVGALREHFIT